MIAFTIHPPKQSYVKVSVGRENAEREVFAYMKNQDSKIVPWPRIEAAVMSLAIYAPYRTLFDRLGGAWPSIEVWNEVAKDLNSDFALQFVPQAHESLRAKKKNSSLRNYIDQIVLDGQIPTRSNNTHDLFNAMTFLLFPKLKFALMKLHFDEKTLLGDEKPKEGGRGRSRTQDLATLFDEGGSISFGQRPEDILVFGHGILEQFIFHDQRVRAYCWKCSAPEADFAIPKADRIIAQELITALQTSDFRQLSGEWVPDLLTKPQ